MHLLGTSIRVELNPGTDRSKLLLEIPRWDFHWQGAYVLDPPDRGPPRRRRPGDLPVRHRKAGECEAPLAPRYTLWGEGTTDEMCLGILQVTRG